MSGEIVPRSGSTSSAESGLLGASSESADEPNLSTGLLKVISSRKRNLSHDIRINTPPCGQIARIHFRIKKKLTAHQLGIGNPNELMPPSR